MRQTLLIVLFLLLITLTGCAREQTLTDEPLLTEEVDYKPTVKVYWANFPDVELKPGNAYTVEPEEAELILVFNQSMNRKSVDDWFFALNPHGERKWLDSQTVHLGFYPSKIQRTYELNLNGVLSSTGHTLDDEEHITLIIQPQYRILTWDPDTKELSELLKFEHDVLILGGNVSPDGKWLLFWESYGPLFEIQYSLLHLETGEKRILTIALWEYPILWYEDSERIQIGSQSFDLTGEVTDSITLKDEERLYGIALDPNGNLAYYTGTGIEVKAIDFSYAQKGELITVKNILIPWAANGGYLEIITTWSADGDRIAFIDNYNMDRSNPGCATIFELSTLNKECLKEPARSILYSPDGSYLAIGMFHEGVEIYSSAQKLIYQCESCWGKLYQWSYDNRYLLIGSNYLNAGIIDIINQSYIDITADPLGWSLDGKGYFLKTP